MDFMLIRSKLCVLLSWDMGWFYSDECFSYECICLLSSSVIEMLILCNLISAVNEPS